MSATVSETTACFWLNSGIMYVSGAGVLRVSVMSPAWKPPSACVRMRAPACTSMALAVNERPPEFAVEAPASGSLPEKDRVNSVAPEPIVIVLAPVTAIAFGTFVELAPRLRLLENVTFSMPTAVNVPGRVKFELIVRL